MEYECRYALQLWLMPQLQHVQICHASNGFFSKEEWTICLKMTSTPRAASISLHTIALLGGRNVNLDEKCMGKKFFSSFYL
jgi:hypothetical protein